jgi:hypothetical protein
MPNMSDLLADALIFELPRQLQERLTRHVRQRRAQAARGRKLGHQHHGLAYDGVDQQPDVHALVVAGRAWSREAAALTSRRKGAIWP